MALKNFKTTANSQSVKAFYDNDQLIKIETLHGTDITSSVASKDLTKIKSQLRKLLESESVESIF